MRKLIAIVMLFSVSVALAQTPPPANTPAPEVQQPDPKTKSYSFTSLAFGPAWGKDMNNSAAFYSFHLGRNWEVDPQAEIRLSGDFALPSRKSGLWASGSLGAAWLIEGLDTHPVTPVVGAEFGFGYANVPHALDPSGFMIGAFAGARLFRTSTTQLSVEVFFQTIMDRNNSAMTGLRIGVLL